MAAKSSKVYWAERAAARERESFLRGAALSDALFRQYEHAAASVRREISDFYAKYATKYGITYDDAVRLLTKSEMREWKYTLEEYQAQINAATDPKVKARLTAQLDALSANSRITRLEALEGKIDLILNQVYDRGVLEMKQEFGELFTEAYYKKHYDIQSRANIFAEIADISEETVENALSYPWSGAMFSDRLWKNKETLLFSVRQILTQGCIQGKSIDAMTQALAVPMGQSYKAAERLIRTEASYLHNEASKKAYEAAEIEEYEFLASLSERTCEICGEMDHRHFPLNDAVAGTNFPPLHPNCRCTTVSYEPDRELIYQTSGEPMPHEMTYAEWKAEQDRLHGEGWVDRERKKAYNKSADEQQFEKYQTVLQELAPKDLTAFQKIKYEDGDAWRKLKSKYRIVNSYKTDSGTVSAAQVLELDDRLISEKRTKFPSDYKRSGNIAGAYLDDDGGAFYIAHSQIDSASDAGYRNYKGNAALVTLKEERRFHYINVPTKAGEKPREDTFHDTEAKLFEYFADLYEQKPFRHITMISERGMCDSCKGVMEQFREMYPSVEINVISNKHTTGDVWKHRGSRK